MIEPECCSYNDEGNIEFRCFSNMQRVPPFRNQRFIIGNYKNNTYTTIKHHTTSKHHHTISKHSSQKHHQSEHFDTCFREISSTQIPSNKHIITENHEKEVIERSVIEEILETQDLERSVIEEIMIEESLETHAIEKNLRAIKVEKEIIQDYNSDADDDDDDDVKKKKKLDDDGKKKLDDDGKKKLYISVRNFIEQRGTLDSLCTIKYIKLLVDSILEERRCSF